jgi:hypothetical protein
MKDTISKKCEAHESSSMVKVNETVSKSHQQLSQQRRNLGRNARRRRKKVLAIEAAAAEAVFCGSSSTVNCKSNSILPQDRGYIWPAVRDLCQLSDNDKQALVGQLGYLPGNAIKITARIKDYFPKFHGGDEPLVLQLYPLVLRDESDSTKSRRKRKRQQDDDSCDSHVGKNSARKNTVIEPFPTMYWVTHPRFRALISKLELTQQQTSTGTFGGNIFRFQERLQEESEALASMKLAHEHYGKQRYDLITKKDWDWIEQRKWGGAFALSRGVAGIRNHAGIKCLHAHAAHYWSGCHDNVVGQWVSEEIVSLLKEFGAKDRGAPTDS